MNKRLCLLIGTLALFGVLPQSAQASCVPADCASMGYTKTSAQCSGETSLVCPFDTSKYFCIPSSKPEVGMIYYTDGTFSNNVEAGKTPLGVVVSVKNRESYHGKVVSLTETSLPFGGGNFDAPIGNFTTYATLDMGGRGNSDSLSSYETSGSWLFKAARYCYENTPIFDSRTWEHWYLPSAGEFTALSLEYEKINATLSKLSKPQMSTGPSPLYWVSTEYDANQAHACVWVSSGSSSCKPQAKTATFKVRCFLEF